MHTTHFALLSLALLSTGAFARLPAPSEEAKAKAAEAADKAAWTGKVGAFQLCKAQNQAVADHHATMTKAGKAVQPVDASLPACTDPGEDPAAAR